MLGAPADLLSLVYLAVAVYTLWQLPSRWRALLDAEYTDEDRNLASRIGFLLLTPVGVLIHELAHMLAATLLGGRDISLSFRIYWGFVQYRGQIGPTAEWIVAAAGPGSSLLLGLVVGYVALFRLAQPWRDIGMSFAHGTLLLVLVLYPGISVLEGVGDFRWIYSARTPTLSVVAGVVHALGMAAYIVLALVQSRQARRERRAAWTARYAEHHVTLRPEILARLDQLESFERVRQLQPTEREQLNELRELRSWTEEHNRTVVARPAGESPPSAPDPPLSERDGPA
jgi:hypothetical protein